MTHWHLSSLYVFLLRQSGASLSCGPRGLGGGVCPHLGLHTREEVSYAVYQRSRRVLGDDRLLGDGMEALPANLLPVPAGETTVRSHGGNQDGELAVLPHHGRFLISRSDELGWQ